MTKPSKAEQYAEALRFARNSVPRWWYGKPDGLDGARATARITEKGDLLLAEGSYNIAIKAEEVRSLLPWLHENFDLQEANDDQD